MKYIVGIFGILAGIALGLYMGLWICFIGGIVDIVQAVKGDVSAIGIMWGLIKMFFATVVGWFSFAILFIPSVYLMGATKVKVKFGGNSVRFNKR